MATVITNKKHLSHLCYLFSFNMRSMLVEICELRKAWEERGALVSLQTFGELLCTHPLLMSSQVSVYTV